MTQVVVTDEFEVWFLSLASRDAKAVSVSVGLLEQRGIALAHPYSSQIKGSRYALRELRVQSGGRALRAIYAFDPVRRAVLLIGGDKTGDKRFYRRTIRTAEKIWTRYLAEIQRLR